MKELAEKYKLGLLWLGLTLGLSLLVLSFSYFVLDRDITQQMIISVIVVSGIAFFITVIAPITFSNQ